MKNIKKVIDIIVRVASLAVIQKLESDDYDVSIIKSDLSDDEIINELSKDSEETTGSESDFISDAINQINKSNITLEEVEKVFDTINGEITLNCNVAILENQIRNLEKGKLLLIKVDNNNQYQFEIFTKNNE